MNTKIINSSDLNNPKDNNSKKRSALLFSVFFFPIILSSLVFLSVFLLSDIDFNKIGPASDFAEISKPINRTPIKGKFKIEGTVNAPIKNHSFYLVEKREGKFWPKFSLGDKPNSWRKELTLRAKKNKYASFQVVMANEKLQKTLDDWFKTAKDTGQYPGITDLEIEHTVAKIRIKKI